MIADKFVMQLSAFSLSMEHCLQKIDDMFADILDQVIEIIKSSLLPIWSLQIERDYTCCKLFPLKVTFIHTVLRCVCILWLLIADPAVSWILCQQTIFGIILSAFYMWMLVLPHLPKRWFSEIIVLKSTLPWPSSWPRSNSKRWIRRCSAANWFKLECGYWYIKADS